LGSKRALAITNWSNTLPILRSDSRGQRDSGAQTAMIFKKVTVIARSCEA
jgi:hypothetical protein